MYIIPAASSPNQKRLDGWLYRRVQLSIVPSICQKCDILVTNVTLFVPFYAKRRELVLEKLAGPVKPESPMEEPGLISNERTFWRKQWGEGSVSYLASTILPSSLDSSETVGILHEPRHWAITTTYLEVSHTADQVAQHGVQCALPRRGAVAAPRRLP